MAALDALHVVSDHKSLCTVCVRGEGKVDAEASIPLELGLGSVFSRHHSTNWPEHSKPIDCNAISKPLTLHTIFAKVDGTFFYWSVTHRLGKD